LFGVGHVEKGASLKEAAGLILLTGAGGAIFSWLLVQWNSLWPPFSLHCLMNLSWELFSVANTALGGWFPFALQTACVVFAVSLTLVLRRIRPAVVPGPNY
jgi:membrane protease YdiL (CAAX protease family)